MATLRRAQGWHHQRKVHPEARGPSYFLQAAQKALPKVEGEKPPPQLTRVDEMRAQRTWVHGWQRRAD